MDTPDWYDVHGTGRQSCPACTAGGHCGGGSWFCECRCTESARPFSLDVLDFARDALARARQISAASIARTDQLTADLRVRRSRLDCVRCFGDPADTGPGWPSRLGQGPCTCELRCARLFCQASEDGELP